LQNESLGNRGNFVTMLFEHLELPACPRRSAAAPQDTQEICFALLKNV